MQPCTVLPGFSTYYTTITVPIPKTDTVTDKMTYIPLNSANHGTHHRVIGILAV